MIKRALISVFYKDGILDFAKFLTSKNVEIVSTGGTYKYLKENNIPVIEVAEVTGAKEMLDGRVKTLDPKIHGAILAIRDNPVHMETIKERGITPIDMVIVNLYPFFEKVQDDSLKFEEKIEFIDIGGPTMLRSAAKSFKDVVVISDVKDYDLVKSEMEKGEVSLVKSEMEKGEVSFETKKYLASKVFNLTSAYDAAVSEFMFNSLESKEDKKLNYLNMSYALEEKLRYGENPHQGASYYVSTTDKGSMKGFEQLNGKELSFNNIRDMDIALKIVLEFDEAKNEYACSAIKHSTPCGAALGSNVLEAYTRTYNCDPTSIFGGIVAFNSTVDEATAKELVKIFLEIVIAKDFTPDALEVLKTKNNLRVIKYKTNTSDKINLVKVDGGLLVQDEDSVLVEDYKVVTEKKPTEEEMKNLIFGMKVVKYAKSNAIVVIKDFMAKGIGSGQTNRIWACEDALERAGDGVVMASDAFFPFRDVVDACAKYNIKAIIQPGGSIRDKESIEACNEHGIAMVFTGIRHFKH